MLSDINVKNAKPLDKAYKLADGNGMYLLVHPNGGKYFCLDYRFEAKRKALALGTYPDVPLKTARDKVFYRQTANCRWYRDPAAHKQAVKSARAESAPNSLEVIA